MTRASWRIRKDFENGIKKTRLAPSLGESGSRCCSYPGESYTFYQDKKLTPDRWGQEH